MRFLVTFIALVAALLILGIVWFDALSAFVLDAQRTAQNAMARAVHAVRSGQPMAVVSLCFVTASYGFLHALGPGHGKAALGAAALGMPVAARRIVIATVLASLAQSLTAIVIVLAVVLLVETAVSSASASVEQWLTPVGHLVLAILGVWLLVRGGRSLWRRATGAEAHTCHHTHGPDAEAVENAASWRALAAVIFAVALRPCTGALFLLAIAWRFDILMVGVLGVLAMGLGTAAFNASFALFAVAARSFATRLTPSFGIGLVLVTGTIQVVVGAGVLALGLSLAWQALT